MQALIDAFLTDLTNANRSAHTVRSYKSDLTGFTENFKGASLEAISTEELRQYFSGFAKLSPASRARKQSSLAAFFAWSRRHGHIAANPMELVDRVKLPLPTPRGVPADRVKSVLAQIPASRPRDRLLFKLIAETGVRASEALGLHIEDLDLTKDDEHLSVLGKGNKRRTILLDDTSLVAMLRAYLKATGYKHGPLFRADKNSIGGPLRYQSAQELWQKYCDKAGVTNLTIHQLRHTHATRMVNEGVSLTTIKRRLGHANMQTTLRYAEQTDQAADRELREWRRRQIVR